ncbi:MAG: M50 family metallopeptidase [Bacilli bacterium]
MSLTTIITAIVIFGTIIFVHELGHLIFAKKFGVFCREFSLGMGPKLFSKKFGETLYSIRVLPIGGFVSMAGENDDGDDVPVGRTLNDIHKLKQSLIIFGGAFFNFILGFIILLGMNFYIGSGEYEPIVGEIIEGSLAEEMHISSGFKIISVNGKSVSDFDSMVDDINNAKKSGDINIVFKKGDKTITINETGVKEDFTIGIKYKSASVSRNPILIFKNTFTQFFEMIFAMFNGFYNLIVQFSENKNSVGGPVMIVNVIGDSVQAGILYLFQVVALLSINLGVVNLLPIPGLDGSKILIAIGEFITKKEIPRKLYIGLSLGGIVFLLFLMILITFNDIINLI